MLMLLAIVAIGIVGLAYLLYNVKNLIFTPKCQFIEISIEDENFLLVSDLHIATKQLRKSDLHKIGDYMARENIRSLFILGDLFDDFHKKISTEHLSRELKKALKLLKLPEKSQIFITFSRNSHDPIISADKIELTLDSLNIIAANKPIRLCAGETTLILLHGDLAVKNGALAYIINKVGNYFQRKYFVEESLKKKLGINKDSWLVMGHTHIPFINKELKIANTGCWKHYWREESDTAILYRNGELMLVKI